MAGSSPAHAGRLMDLAAGVTAANYTLKKALPAKRSRRDL